MSLILNIDTALDKACISLSEDDNVLKFAINESQGDHASWIQGAIQNMALEMAFEMRDIKAVSVNKGPGSYTGLRIGLSTAKGLCYALNIPLITVNSLEVIAFGAIKDIETSKNGFLTDDFLFCPMIDARRMDVFTAIYDSNLTEIVKPHALILDKHSFEEILKRQKILFLGNGSVKFEQICHNHQAMFKNFPLNPAAQAAITYKNFIGNNFAGLAYTEPLYLKEFFTTKAIEPPKGN